MWGVAAVGIKILSDVLNQPWLSISKVSSSQRSLGRRVVRVAEQLKCGEREENVEVIGYFCQWRTPKALRALWPVNAPCAPGLFHNLSLGTRALGYSVGAKLALFPVPRTGVLLLGDAWQRLQKA